MAIGALFEVPGFTQDDYDAVVAVVGDVPPEGACFHIAGPIDGGWRVIEVWDSEEAQRAFQAERLNPALDTLGLERPTATFFPVHNTFPPPEAMAEMMSGGGGPASG
jgi:hypothetical protein